MNSKKNNQKNNRNLKIFYLHGFRGHYLKGSKIRFLQATYGKENVIGFDLYNSPIQNIEKIKQVINELYLNDEKIFIGTSLGGYYAFILSHIYDSHLLLINPVINPSITMQNFVNKKYFSFQDENKTITITNNDLEEFKQLSNLYENIEQNNKFIHQVWIGKYDEFYSNVNKVCAHYINLGYSAQIFENESHRFTGFEEHFPTFYNKVLNHNVITDISDSNVWSYLLQYAKENHKGK